MLNKHVRGMFLLSPSISVGISTDIAPCWRWSLSVKRLKIWMRSHFTRGGRKKEVGAPFCHKGLGAHCRYPQSLHVMWGSGPFVATTNFRTVSALSLSRIHVPSACTKAKALGSVPEHTATWCQLFNYKVIKLWGSMQPALVRAGAIELSVKSFKEQRNHGFWSFFEEKCTIYQEIVSLQFIKVCFKSWVKLMGSPLSSLRF